MWLEWLSQTLSASTRLPPATRAGRLGPGEIENGAYRLRGDRPLEADAAAALQKPLSEPVDSQLP